MSLPGLFARALLLAIFIAAIALIGEAVVVFGLRLNGHDVLFSSFWALALFSALVGFIPTQPSPSRISSKPIGLMGRLLLAVEIGALVAVAMLASSKFMAYRHIQSAVEIWFAAYEYGLILVVMSFANLRRLRQEILAARRTSPPATS